MRSATLANKKFVVTLGGEECKRLMTKRRQSDEEISRALDTNITMVARVREKLMAEGPAVVLKTRDPADRAHIR